MFSSCFSFPFLSSSIFLAPRTSFGNCNCISFAWWNHPLVIIVDERRSCTWWHLAQSRFEEQLLQVITARWETSSHSGTQSLGRLPFQPLVARRMLPSRPQMFRLDQRSHCWRGRFAPGSAARPLSLQQKRFDLWPQLEIFQWAQWGTKRFKLKNDNFFLPLITPVLNVRMSTLRSCFTTIFGVLVCEIAVHILLLTLTVRVWPFWERYVRSLLDSTGMNQCKSMATPGSKDQERQATNDKLDPQEHREFRSGAGICQYMTEQRFDVAFSTKEIMRDAAGPTTASKAKLKRITRYIKGRQRCVLNFHWVTTLDDVIHVTVDADWAGDPKTRCFTSGGVLAFGPCFTVRHWSVTQATVSLSSAESEAKAMTKGMWNIGWNIRLRDHSKNWSLDRQQQRQGHHATTWTRAQGKTRGGADVMGSAAGKDRSHLVERGGYAGELCRCYDKTRAAYSTS